MKKLFFLLFVYLLSANPALAHTLKTDGSIGAVLHVTPEDDPIVGEATNFFFDIKDKSNKFTPESCDCIASILQDGKEISTQSLFQNNPNPSLEDASFSYRFPQRNVYMIRIVGKPKTQGTFEPFTLEWDQRVARVSEDSKRSATEKNSSGIWKWIFPVVGLAFIGYIIYYSSVRKDKSKI